MSATEKELLDCLENLDIPFRLYRHPPFFTVEDSRGHRGDMPGGRGKCLFLRDKKGNMILAAVHEEVRADLKKLAEKCGVKRLGFGNAQRMARVLGVKPGAVTPFSLVNYSSENLKAKETFQVVMDRTLMDFDTVYFHPLHNEATVGLSPDALLTFIRHFGFEPRIMDLA